jgi:hypothetical protein
MTSSLNAGPQLKVSRLSKLTNMIAGSRIKFFAGSKLQIPVESALPATCAIGELCANGADANKLYQCTATNTWTKVGTQA